MTRARDLADSADKDIAGTLTLDGLTVDGDVAIASDLPSITLTDNNNSSSRADIEYNFGYLSIDADANSVDAAEAIDLKIGGTTHFRLATGGDISFYEDTGTTAKLFWDASAERLGLGTVSPQSQIAVSNAATTDVMEFDTAPGFSRFMSIDRTTGDEKYLQIRAKSIGFALDSGADNVTIDSSGNVGIGTSSPTVTLDVAGTGRFLKTDNNSNIILETTDADANAAPVLDMYRNSASPADGDQLGKIEFSGENSNGDKTIYGFLRAQIRSTTAGAESPKISLHALKDGSEINFFEYDGANAEVVVNEGAQDIAFRVETPGLTHALCTTSAGIDGVRIGTATSISDCRLAIHNSGTGPNTEMYRASTSTSGDVLSIRSNVGGSQTLVAGFEANGDIMSATQNVQAPSDIKLKQDIVDCTSQWDDIKALQLKNYRMKSHVVEMGDDAPTHLGVIAQEVEAAGMTGLVDDKPDIDGDFDGPSTKVVKYTMIYLKAVKALQEAMAKIEVLETKVAALEAE